MLPYLNHIAEDQDVTVRNVAVQILLDLCQMCDSQKCQDFLDIIEKVTFKFDWFGYFLSFTPEWEYRIYSIKRPTSNKRPPCR